MTWFEAFVLAVVEGVTEFLPISSTGHMVLTSTFFGIQENEFVKVFTVAVQLGAILAVVWLYWRRFLDVSIPFYRNIVVAAIPAVVLGFTLEKHIDRALESPWVVVTTMILGGFVLIGLDRWLPAPKEETEPTPRKAFHIGLFQCLALIPGTSRSAATIIGGMVHGLSRKQAAEFSFFLAVPIMLGATLLKLWKVRSQITEEHIGLLLFGNVVAFVVAALVIKAFIRFLANNGMKIFGYYRIIVGLTILAILLVEKAS